MPGLRLFYPKRNQHTAQPTAAQSFRHSPQLGYRKRILSQRFQSLLILAKALGHSGGIGGKLRVFFLQDRDHPVAQAVAQKILCAVGAIGNIAEVEFLQKIQHLLPGNVQHRADDPAPHRSNAPQPLQPRTPHQVHQHSFGVVVSGVGRGDLAGQGIKKGVAGFPGGGFQALFPGGHLAAAQMQGDIKAAAEGFYKIFIPLGFLTPKTVVKMGRFQGNSQLILQQVQGKGKRYGIRAAGQGADYLVAGAQHIIAFYKRQQGFIHASTPGRRIGRRRPAIGA